MAFYRRLTGAVTLFAISAALTSFWNGFVAIIADYAANLYYAGFATVALSLCLHGLVVRRFLPLSSVSCQLLGVAISGVFSFVLYDLFHGYTQHFTYLQREGASVNWGDDGRFSGLGHHALGFHWPTFYKHLPVTLIAGCLYGLVWFPCLAWLERWSHAELLQNPDAGDHETQAA
jgi:hypothetical protein